jgi:uncharacterized damage-inducible protein DinB
MNWTDLLKSEIESTYRATENLLDLVDDEALDWRPATGSNWMTTGQLLKHITEACGVSVRGFITGDWGLPEGTDMSDLSPEDMLPPAEALPSIESVAAAKQALAADKQLALSMLADTPDLEEPTAAPWDPSEVPLGQRLLQMVDHLKQHKAQLFYYLKLQGNPVNTTHLWGM